MITRYYAPIKTKLRNSFLFSLIPLVQSAVFGIIELLLYVYSGELSPILPFAVAMFILALLMFCWKFNPGKPHEAYILSDRTLAVVRAGRKVRFIKARDLRAYRPFAGIFRLQGGATFMCQSYDGSAGRKEVPLALFQRWYDGSHQESLKDITDSHHLVSGAGVTTAIVVCATAIATMVYAAVFRHEDLGFWGQVLLGAGMLSAGLPIILRRRRISLPLRENGAPRRASLLRIPHEKPRICALAVPYALMAVVLAGSYPLMDFFVRYVPPGPELSKAVSAVSITALLLAVYLAWRFYQRIVRGDLFTTVLISSRTLIVLHPRRRKRRLRRVDCVAWQPHDDSIVLRNGETFHFGVLPSIEAASAALSALRRKWWSYVPDRVWRTSPSSPPSERPAQVSLLTEGYPTQMPEGTGDA